MSIVKTKLSDYLQQYSSFSTNENVCVPECMDGKFPWTHNDSASSATIAGK